MKRKGIVFIPIIIAVMLGMGAVWIGTSLIKDITNVTGKLILIGIGAFIAYQALVYQTGKKRFDSTTLIWLGLAFVFVFFGLLMSNIQPFTIIAEGLIK